MHSSAIEISTQNKVYSQNSEFSFESAKHAVRTREKMTHRTEHTICSIVIWYTQKIHSIKFYSYFVCFVIKSFIFKRTTIGIKGEEAKEI